MTASTLDNEINEPVAKIKRLLEDSNVAEAHSSKAQLMDASNMMADVIDNIQRYCSSKNIKAALKRKLETLETTCQDNLISIAKVTPEQPTDSSIKTWFESRKKILKDDLRQLEQMVEKFIFD